MTIDQFQHRRESDDAAERLMDRKELETSLSTAQYYAVALEKQVKTLRALGAAIIKANDEFRASLPPDWDGDPVNDACEAARTAFV